MIVLVAMSLIFGWLVPAFSMMGRNAVPFGILRLLFGWILPVIQLVLFRVMLEPFIATIRIAQNTAGTRQEIQVLRQEIA
ncbi:DUF4282 domain-containing protein [Auritidibacter ignavus]|uniref:DUF4282 domain-containing protein n=1 Tax=Auritidibacter ignavus TaxID=678932 RepID=UPI002105754A|nr:DUF4282 domain-containing protein [Auritidibacter ignavus]